MLGRIFPHARFLHVIRDGRDGAVSGRFHNLRVSKEWAELAETGRWPTEVRPHTRNRRHVLRRVMTPDG